MTGYDVVLALCGLAANGLLAGIFLRLGSVVARVDEHGKSISALWNDLNKLRGMMRL